MTYRTVATNRLTSAYRWISRGCNALDSMPKKLLERVESRFAFPSMVTPAGASIPSFAPLLAISTKDYVSTGKQIGIQQTLDALIASIRQDQEANKLPLEKLVSYAQKLLALKSTNEAKDSQEIMLGILNALNIISDKLELRQDYHTSEVASFVVSNKLLFSQEYKLLRSIQTESWKMALKYLSGKNLDPQQQGYVRSQNNFYLALLEFISQDVFSKIAMDDIAFRDLVDFCTMIESIGSEKEKTKLALLKYVFAIYLLNDILLGRRTDIPQKIAISYCYSLAPNDVVRYVLELADTFSMKQAKQLPNILPSIEPQPLKEIAKAATYQQMEGLMLAAIGVKEQVVAFSQREFAAIKLRATADEVFDKLFKASSLDKLADTALQSPLSSPKLFINLADFVGASALNKLMGTLKEKNGSLKTFLLGLSEPGIRIPSILLKLNDKVFAAAIKAAFSYDDNQKKDDPFILILTEAVKSSPSLIDKIAEVLKVLDVEKDALAKVANYPSLTAALLARVAIE